LPNSEEKLKLGLIGCGRRGRILLSAILEHSLFEVQALAAQNEAALTQAALYQPRAKKYSHAHELLDTELDAVLVATPPATHGELSIAALHAGKDVLCEVPAVISVDEAQALVEAVKSSGRVFALAENACFGETVQALRRFLTEEPLGPYLHCEGTYAEDCREDAGGIIYGRDTGEPFWRSEHLMSNYTTHSLGPLIYLTGHRVTQVVGMMSNMRRQTGRELAIASSILCYTDQGAVFHSFQSGLCPRLGFHWRLTGEGGTIESSPFQLEEKKFLLYRAGARVGTKGQQLRLDLPPSEPYLRYQGTGRNAAEKVMLDEFANAIRRRPTTAIDIYSALSMSLPGVLGDLSVQREFQPIEMPEFALGSHDAATTAK
jgi:predicted dehydrogenase